MTTTPFSIPKEQQLVGFDAIKSDGSSIKLIAFTAPVPVPGDDDVLVHISDTAMNPVEWKLAASNFLKRTGNVALGFDYAGKVAAVGSNVTHVKPGDDIIGLLYITQQGGYAADGKGAYQVGPAKLVIKRDPRFPAEIAATYPIAYLSVWDGLQNNLKDGQSIYIPGVAGGVPHFAIQFAKTRTGKILTSASRPETEAVAKQLKVPYFNYKSGDVESEVKKHFPQGADVVYDAIYQASSFVTSAKALAPGGTLVILGALPAEDSETVTIVQQKGGRIAQADLLRYFFKPQQNDLKFLQQGFEQAQKWYIDGTVRPIISKSINANVKNLQQVLEEAKAGKTIGKIAVKNVY